jgi:hypothetical protein
VDETPQQLIGEVRTALPPIPGQPARHDYEYRRNGTANVFVAVDAHQPRRFTQSHRAPYGRGLRRVAPRS